MHLPSLTCMDNIPTLTTYLLTCKTHTIE
jgi:hypothetical protein